VARPPLHRIDAAGDPHMDHKDADDLMRWQTPARWVAARRAELRQAAEAEPEALPTTYQGTDFRSQLEAGWARTLDHLRIEWEYERRQFRLPSGAWYLPDFWLPAVRTFIEVKGAHVRRRHKPEELAAEVDGDTIVLIGWPPLTKQVTSWLWDPYLQWLDPLGYDTRLAQCPECSGWQWMRAQLSRQCRLCGTGHTGLLAKGGEMPFYPAQPDRPSWLESRLCRGIRWTTISTMTRRSPRPARQP
jgi:hypothetical protein